MGGDCGTRASLLDLLERRMRMAILSQDRGEPQIDRIAEVAGRAAGWDETRRKEEAQSYKDRLKNHYSIHPNKI